MPIGANPKREHKNLVRICLIATHHEVTSLASQDPIQMTGYYDEKRPSGQVAAALTR